jgi:hypothetical protein
VSLGSLVGFFTCCSFLLFGFVCQCSFALFGFCEAGFEAVDTTFGVDDLLFAGEEWVARLRCALLRVGIRCHLPI